MSGSQVFLTPEGIQKLREELEYLYNVRRPEIAAQLQEAKSHGDITDSSGYEDAKTTQAFIEGRIRTLENLLRNAVLLNNAPSDGMVCLGSRVTVQEEGQEPEEFVIVGAAEADPVAGRISDQSPLGRALLGSRVGDQVIVEAPRGKLRFRVLKIS